MWQLSLCKRGGFTRQVGLYVQIWKASFKHYTRAYPACKPNFHILFLKSVWKSVHVIGSCKCRYWYGLWQENKSKRISPWIGTWILGCLWMTDQTYFLEFVWLVIHTYLKIHVLMSKQMKFKMSNHVRNIILCGKYSGFLLKFCYLQFLKP